MKRRSVLPPKGSVIVCGTRYATGDLWARLQEDEAKGGEVWSRLVLPLVDLSGEATIETGALLCPEMVGREEARKRSLRREFWAMDQQQPFDAETALIRASYLQRRYAARPERVERVVLAVDLAFKDHKSGSRCAFQAWAKEGPDFYLLDQVVGHMTAPKAIATIKHLARKWPTATVLIEDKANGPAVAQLLKEEISGIVTVTPQRSKVDRVHAILKLFEGGNVVLPESALHAWVDEFISEAVRFPNGDKDDLVDACSMALHRLLTSGPVSYYGGDSRFWDTPTLIHGGVGGYDGGRRAMTERPDHSSDWTSPSRRTGEWF